LTIKLTQHVFVLANKEPQLPPPNALAKLRRLLPSTARQGKLAFPQYATRANFAVYSLHSTQRYIRLQSRRCKLPASFSCQRTKLPATARNFPAPGGA